MFTLTIRDHDEADNPRIQQWNVSRLSITTGYSKSHISRVLRRESNPSVRCLWSLAEALGVSPEYLMNRIKEGKVKVNAT